MIFLDKTTFFFNNFYTKTDLILFLQNLIPFIDKNRSDLSLQIKFSFIHKTDLNFLKREDTSIR